jgi:hypothetical protein
MSGDQSDSLSTICYDEVIAVKKFETREPTLFFVPSNKTKSSKNSKLGPQSRAQ